MFDLIKNLSAPRYETKAMLKSYLSAQYGVFLNPQNLVTEKYYQQLLEIAQTYIKDKVCLDVGCATGRFVFEYANRGSKSSTGIDTSSVFIAKCNEIKEVGLENFHPTINNVVFLVDDILLTKLNSGNYDFISCVSVLDRVKDPFELVETLLRLLKNDGILLLSSPNDWNNSPAPKRLQKQNVRDFFNEDDWIFLEEKANVPFKMIVGNNVVDYDSDVLVARKKEQ